MEIKLETKIISLVKLVLTLKITSKSGVVLIVEIILAIKILICIDYKIE